MLNAVHSWFTRRRHRLDLQAEYFALADELLELDPHLAAAPAANRDELRARQASCRRRMAALRQHLDPAPPVMTRPGQAL